TIKFLEGRTDEVISELTGKMTEAADAYDYERAAMFRDQIKAVERVMERQQMATTKPEDIDVFGLARKDDEACVQVFFVRGTKVVGRDHFLVHGVKDEPDAAVLSSFLEQFYESALYIPRDILLPAGSDETSLLTLWLSGKRGKQVTISVPQRGERKRLVDLANENAVEALEMMRVKWMADKGKTQTALEQI